MKLEELLYVYKEKASDLTSNISKKHGKDLADRVYFQLKDYLSFDDVVSANICIEAYDKHWDKDYFEKLVATFEGFKNKGRDRVHGMAMVRDYGDILGAVNVARTFKNLELDRDILDLKDLYKDEKTIKVLAKYKDVDYVMKKFAHVLNDTSTVQYVQLALGKLNNQRVLDNQEHKLVIDYAVYTDMSKTNLLIDFLEKYDFKFQNKIRKIGYSANLKELLTERAYNVITKYPHRFEKIASTKSGKYKHLALGEFGDKLDYKYLDILVETFDFVQNVHENRDVDAMNDICMYFWRELNRAIDQADEYSGKIKNLCQFCYEVKGRMEENIDDLMVITNGS